jgi:hypothetical protein
MTTIVKAIIMKFEIEISSAVEVIITIHSK